MPKNSTEVDRGSASYNANMLEVLYEDNHLLVVNKPAMLPTMGVAEDRNSLLAVAKEYIREKYQKPGNVYLGIVSRLDAPVTGVVLIARTSKAAGRLAEQFRDRHVEKTYWAIVEGRPASNSGTLTDYMRKDERHRRMHIAAKNAPEAQLAELSYRLLGEPRLKPGLRHFAPRGFAEDRPQAPDSCPAFARRFSDLGRPQICQHPAVFPGNCPTFAAAGRRASRE